MENYYSFINVKCNQGYAGQFENNANVNKIFGNNSSHIERIYKCYGDFDFVIWLKPSQSIYRTADECIAKLRAQSWVSDTRTFFGEECYNTTHSNVKSKENA